MMQTSTLSSGKVWCGKMHTMTLNQIWRQDFPAVPPDWPMTAVSACAAFGFGAPM